MTREDMLRWNAETTSKHGEQIAISPEKQGCEYTHINRVNLRAGEKYTVQSSQYEMFISLIEGKAHVKLDGFFDCNMNTLDACYMNGNQTCILTAQEDCCFYIAFAQYEGIGEPIFLPHNPAEPLGAAHQIHGEGVSRREVYLPLNDTIPASRLMCGYTIGSDAGWTSWPPHEHAATLEETYCYYGMAENQVGIQYTYLEAGGMTSAIAHFVKSGNMVVFPCGYHPTSAPPGTTNKYMWVLVARRPEFRKYGVVNVDPAYN